MHEHALPLGVFAGQVVFPVLPVRGHRAGDRVVEAVVEHMKLRGADRCVGLTCQLRYDLTDIAVPVHHLTDGKAISQQLTAVKR